MRLSKLKLSIGAFLVMLSLALVTFAGMSLNSAHASSAQHVNARAVALQKSRASHHRASCNSRGNFYASPCSVTETTAGNVSYALIGSNLIPLTAYTIYAPTLSQACSKGNSIDGTTVTTDFTGSFNDTGTGVTCVAGRYTIELQENVSPFTVYSTVLVIKQP